MAAPSLSVPAPLSRGEMALWSAIVLLYLAIRVQLLAVPLERDEGLFASIGARVLAGDLPYRDVFEHKPPGIFYVYALALALVPATTLGLHGFVAAWNLGTLLAAGGVARRLGGSRAGVAAALLFAIGSSAPSTQGFTGSSEMLLLLPLTASLWAALRAAGTGGGVRAAWLVASGALGALAVWIKQPAALALAVVPLAIALGSGPPAPAADADVGTRRRGAIADLAVWLAGALAVTAVATIPFLLAGVGSEFVYWSFTHSLLYGQVSASDFGLRVANRALDLAQDLSPAMIAAVAGCALDVARRRPRAWIAPAFLALSIASAMHSPFLYVHYFALLVPAVAIAGGVGFAVLQGEVERRLGGTAARIAGAAGAAVVLAVPLAARPWYWLLPDPVAVVRGVLGAQGFEAAPAVADFLRERTRPDDTVLVYGSEPQIPFLAGRRDPNPFVVAYPLTWSWPRHREFQERVWAAVERRRPAYLVIARSPYSLSRSPGADPFLEERLTELGAAEYDVEAVVFESARGRALLAPVDAMPEPVAREQIVLELWRRREPAPGGGAAPAREPAPP